MACHADIRREVLIIKRCFLLLSLVVMMLLTACLDKKSADMRKSESLLMYSEISKELTEDIVAAYNVKQQGKIVLQAVYSLPTNNDAQPDLILAERGILREAKMRGQLQPAEFLTGDLIPPECKDEDSHWFGIFYDPVVFLVNQQFSRNFGQHNLTTWNDLNKQSNIRVVMENLSDNDSTKNFLGSFASRLGENEAFSYLKTLNKHIQQYAKFPFTPVRMVAVGDADVAVTRISYVFKYLESDFPAYIVHPEDGAPINLYCIGIYASSAKTTAAKDFLAWLIASNELQRTLQKNFNGYMSVFPRGIENSATDVKKMWINKEYQTGSAKEELVAKWIESIRFSK